MKHPIVRIAAFATLVMLCQRPAVAQDAGSPPATAPVSAPARPSTAPAWPDCEGFAATPPQPAEVIDAFKLTRSARQAGQQAAGQSAPASRDREVKLRDSIVIEVKNLDSLRRRQECGANGGKKRPLVLYLDEHQLADIQTDPSLDPAEGILIFPLVRSETSRKVWTDLLGRPGWGARKVEVSVGLEDEYAIPSDALILLEVLPRSWFIFWCLLFVAIAYAFWKVARRTAVLRDSIHSTAVNEKKPWSLARVQAAWWFFLVLASYLFIGCVTGDYSTTITGTVLVLLGIAAGTTVTSTAMDDGRDTPENRALEQATITRLETEIATLEGHATALATRIAAGNASTQDKIDHPSKLADLIAKRSQLKKQMRESEGFFKDLLSDANGVNFHRFQVATWTLVLGFVFGFAVYRELAMPQFSETLLGLMGLSAGTFVAMKNTEANVPKP